MPTTPPPALPPDRGHIETEGRHEASADLDALAPRSVVELIVEDHRRVTEAVAAAAPAIGAFGEALVPRMERGGRLIYVGAGTSGRLGVLDAAECPPTFQSDPRQVVGIIAGGDAALRRSSEGREDDPDGAAADLDALALSRDDTVLGIAAGGTTPYVRGAITHAARRGAATALLTCAAGTAPPRECGQLIVLHTGPELLTGSTRLKAGSATKLALNAITTAAFVRLGNVYGNLMVDLRASNAKLADRAIRIVRELCPSLGREAAAELLRRADGHVKAAVVMEKCGVDLETAQRLLDASGGLLRRVLQRTE